MTFNLLRSNTLLSSEVNTCAWRSSLHRSRPVCSRSGSSVRYRTRLDRSRSSTCATYCSNVDRTQQRQIRQRPDRQQRHNKQQQSASPQQQLTDEDPLALAFLGDAIWSLYVRNHFLNPPKHFRLYQAAVKPYITAEGQAVIYDSLLEQQVLSQQEQQYLQHVYRWKYVKFRKRFASPAAEAIYRKATALEALVGYLHRNQPDRLEQLVKAALPDVATPAGSITSDQSVT